MGWTNLEWVLDEPRRLYTLADDIWQAAGEELRPVPRAGEFAVFFAALLDSLVANRPEWPLHRFLADAEDTDALIARACDVAALPRFERCVASRRLRRCIRPLWAECLAREAVGWHRAIAWDRRPTLSTGSSALCGRAAP